MPCRVNDVSIGTCASKELAGQIHLDNSVPLGRPQQQLHANKQQLAVMTCRSEASPRCSLTQMVLPHDLVDSASICATAMREQKMGITQHACWTGWSEHLKLRAGRRGSEDAGLPQAESDYMR